MNVIGDAACSSIWTIYAFGGGMGHLTRALSLARYVARNGIRVRILCNSPFLSAFLSDRVRRLILLEPLIDLIAFSSSLGRDELARSVLHELQRFGSSDVFVVDTFPRGIGGELTQMLSELKAYRVFVHRDLNPEYVRQFNLVESIDDYDVVLVPGEDAPLQHLAHSRTQPWFICDCNEMLPRTEALRCLGVFDDRLPLTVVIGSGTAQEAIDAAELARLLSKRLAGQSVVRFATFDEAALASAREIGCTVWPLLAAYRGIDLVIGAGGYHTVNEARWTGTPLLAVPQHRQYDRQAIRLQLWERVHSIDDLVRNSRRLVRQRLETPKDVRMCVNGAAQAFALIAEARNRTRVQ